jgi:hypothetical protein
MLGWRDFLDIELIALVSKHVSGALAIIAGFLVIGLAANWAIKDPFVGPVVHYAETVIVTACVLRAIIVMLWKLLGITRKTLKGGGNGTTPSILVA